MTRPPERRFNGTLGRRFSYQDREPQPFFNSPPIVSTMLGILILVHVFRIVLPDSWDGEFVVAMAFIPLRFLSVVDPVTSQGFLDVFGGVATLFTHTLVHADLLHLGLNSIWLLAFGSPVARLVGKQRFLVFFFLCGMAGALAHLAFNMTSFLPMIGASGAISGMMGGAARFIFAGPAVEPGVPPTLTSLFDSRVMLFAAVWIVINLLFGIVGLDPTGETRLIAWEAHLGGFIMGILFFPFFMRKTWSV